MGRGLYSVYSVPLYLQLGHGIGNFFGSLFRWNRLILWSETEPVGRDTLRTGSKIMTDIVEYNGPR